MMTPKKNAKQIYEKARKDYEAAFKSWQNSPEVVAAPTRFDETLTQLERRGLLQYDHNLKRYDLHPVVRGVAAGRMGEEETGKIGEQVVDHFSSRRNLSFDEAETLEEIVHGIQVVSTLTQIGKFDRAFAEFKGDLHNALQYNLIAFSEIQSLMRPFFPGGWYESPIISKPDSNYAIYTLAANGLRRSNLSASLYLHERSLQITVANNSAYHSRTCLSNIATNLKLQNKLHSASRIRGLASELAEASDDKEDIFRTLLYEYVAVRDMGSLDLADTLWRRLDPMGRNWQRAVYLSGDAELERAINLFWRGALTKDEIGNALKLCGDGRNRTGICECLILNGEWHLSRDEPDVAVDPLNEALRLYREAGQEDPRTEALLALARLRAGQPVGAEEAANRLDGEKGYATALTVAELWRELGETDRAIAAALRAHKSACGSGEPYVYRYYLDRSEALLRELGETPPEVPKHDPANDEVFEWEDDVHALIERTRKEREEREEREEAKAKDE